MKQIKDYSDIRSKAWCIHCTGNFPALKATRDHIPSKCLLLEPLPTNLPVIAICETCNGSYSLDEEYMMVFLEVVLTGTTNPDLIRNLKVAQKMALYELE